MTDETIQAEEVKPADGEELEATEVEETPSDDAVSERTDDVSEVEAETEESDEEEWEPIVHEVPFKSAGEEQKFRLEYDREGNLTPETTESLTQVLAKQGLEKVAQEKDAGWKREQARAESAEARLKVLQRQLDETTERFSKPLQHLKQLQANPQMRQVFQRTGMPEIPDVDAIKHEREQQTFAEEKRSFEVQQLRVQLAGGLRQKYPHLTSEHLDEIGAQLDRSQLAAAAARDTSGSVLSYLDGFLDAADGVVAKMTLDGKLPNPALEEARKATEKSQQETQKARKRAKKVASVTSPLAGGKPKGSAGRKKEVDMRGWSTSEAAEYYRTGKPPVR